MSFSRRPRPFGGWVSAIRDRCRHGERFGAGIRERDCRMASERDSPDASPGAPLPDPGLRPAAADAESETLHLGVAEKALPVHGRGRPIDHGLGEARHKSSV